MKHSVSVPVVSSTAPTTSSPSSSRITSHSSLAEDLGVDPLDDAVPGAEREPGPVGGAARSAPAARSPGSSEQQLADRAARPGGRRRWPTRAARAGRARRAGPAGRGGQDADVAARRGAAPPTTTTSWLARPPPAPSGSSVVVRASRPVEERQDEARVVGDLERGGRRVTAVPGGLEQDRAPRGAVGLGDLGQLVGDHAPQQLPRRPGSRRAPRWSRSQLVLLLLQLEPREPGQPAQLHVEDVVGLDVGEVEDRPSAVRFASAALSLVRISWMTTSMSRMAISRPSTRCSRSLRLVESERRAAPNDVEAVIDVVLAQLVHADGGGRAVDQHDVVDPEGLLERRLAVELGEQRRGVEPGLSSISRRRPVWRSDRSLMSDTMRRACCCASAP